MMSGAQIKELRTRMKLSQPAFAKHLTGALGRNVSASTIGRWENDQTDAPAGVTTYLDGLAIELNFDLGFMPEPAAENEDPDLERHQQPRDSEPGPGPTGPGVEFPGSGSYERICTEMWEMVATGVGMVGAAMGNDRVMTDGRLINQEKAELGKAYARLAESNETFRNMLKGVTSGGTVLQVCFVTGKVAGQIWQNHSLVRSVPPAEDHLHAVPTGPPSQGDGHVEHHPAAS